MSGGQYDYVTFKIDEFATVLRCDGIPRRIAFKELLLLVAKAAYDIEWVDSGDCCPGDEFEAIDAVFTYISSNPDMAYKAAAFDNIKRLLEHIIESSTRT